MKRLIGLVLAVAVVGVIGCSGNPAAPADRLYDIKGKVVAMDVQKPSVTLDHEDIPGLMKAMKMEFAVVDGRVLSGIAVGDTVRGKVQKEGTGYVLRSLEKQAGG
jgi:Cu/Ag efflux protein CusF